MDTAATFTLGKKFDDMPMTRIFIASPCCLQLDIEKINKKNQQKLA
jgi:hypothetical protein